MHKGCKFLLTCTMLFFTGIYSFSQSANSSASGANRRTALRCLSIAKDYVSQSNWQSAKSQLSMGLAYDEEISDLWYLLALSTQFDGSSKAEVLPLVTKALELNKWVDYNRDGARLLYADILCDTGKADQVIGILDATPMIFSADAEFIRVKAYYRMGDSESLSKARRKVDSARKIFSGDMRFPLTFFKYESPWNEDPEVRRLAETFIMQITQFVDASPDKNAELEMYAARFARGSTQERLLKSFSARHLRHPLYAISALKAGLFTEEKAFDYLVSFADENIDYKVLTEFLPLIQSDKVRAQMKEYFDAYAGVIVKDTSGDGIENLFVQYSRGRPQSIFYDENQDGTLEWTLACDFGVPTDGTLLKRKMDFTWDGYPYLKTVAFRNASDQTIQSFNLVGETLKWTPVRIEKDSVISSCSGSAFFFPEVNVKGEDISNAMLINSSASFVIPTQERPEGTITFSVIDGKVELAQYRSKDRLYAQAEFAGNLPKLRVLDSDDDGVFETTEFYDVDSDSSMEVHTLEEERLVMENLFGIPSLGAEFYLRMVQIDTNGDTIPDFTEEYSNHGGTISSWDTNGDGLWEVRFVRFPKLPGEALREEALFYEHPGEKLVTVSFENKVPVKVKTDGEELPVTQDPIYDFYWLGQPGSSSMARRCIIELNSGLPQGVSTVVSGEDERVFCLRMGECNFGISVPVETFPESENEGANESANESLSEDESQQGSAE